MLLPTNNSPFYLAVEKTQSIILPQSSEAIFNKEIVNAVGTVHQAQGSDVTKNKRMDFEVCPEERSIGYKAKAAATQLVTVELTTIVEELLDDILCTSYHNMQNGIRSLVYSVVEHVMLDLLCKYVTDKTRTLS